MSHLITPVCSIPSDIARTLFLQYYKLKNIKYNKINVHVHVMSKEYISSSCKQIEDVNYFFLGCKNTVMLKYIFWKKINEMLPRLSIILTSSLIKIYCKPYLNLVYKVYIKRLLEYCKHRVHVNQKLSHHVF